MSSHDIIDRLRKLDACAVSDALDAVGSLGAVSGIERRATRRRIVGKVQTIRLHVDPPPGGSKHHLGAAVIDGADADTVIVVEQRTGKDCAGWGGVLANAAKRQGIQGVILEGPVRDVDECEDIGFPVFARSVTTRTGRGRVFEESFGNPIKVGNLVVKAGDYVIADGSGVVFIPSEIADKVLERAERVAEKERLMTEAVRAGKPVAEVMGADYEQMLHKFPG